MSLGSLSNALEIRSALSFRGSSVLQQSYPLTGYVSGASAPAAFTPLSLFAAGEQGVWYDPSDLTTMFEDSAGTTPVHTPGNGTADSPVGKILDKSGRGNHATQTTGTARPTLSARYNLLTYTQVFTNAVWTANAATVTDNTTDTTDPLGTNTAGKLANNSTSSEHRIYQYVASTASGVNMTRFVYAKAGTASFLAISRGAAVDGYAVFNLSTGVVASQSGITSASIVSVGNGWYACSVVGIPTQNYIAYNVGTTAANAVPNTAYVGSGEAIYIWGADWRVTNDGVGLPAYQRVVDANTYDSTGFPYYIKFDGVDDCLFTTSTLNLSTTNKACIFSSWRRLANGGVPVEFGASAQDVGSMSLYAGDNGSAAGAYWNAVYRGSGTTQNAQSAANYNAPLTNVVSNIYDISAPSINLRANGSSIATSTTSSGTGNFGNLTLYVGRRANASLSFNGRSYGLIVRGATSTTTEISNTESWLNNYTKAY